MDCYDGGRTVDPETHGTSGTYHLKIVQAQDGSHCCGSVRDNFHLFWNMLE